MHHRPLLPLYQHLRPIRIYCPNNRVTPQAHCNSATAPQDSSISVFLLLFSSRGARIQDTFIANQPPSPCMSKRTHTARWLFGRIAYFFSTHDDFLKLLSLFVKNAHILKEIELSSRDFHTFPIVWIGLNEFKCAQRPRYALGELIPWWKSARGFAADLTHDL